MERRQAFQIRVNAQRRTAAADEPIRWLRSLRLQQSTGAQERTLREERASQPLPVGQDARAWKQETPWLSEAPAHALQQALLDLDRAYQNFFQKRAAFPKFHKKGLRDSFRESDPQCIKLDQANSRMQLPKIGWVRYRNSREVLGAVRSVTVSQSAGKWFVSITTLREVEQPQHPSTSAVGLDWGVASFVSMSNGEVIEQLQPLKKFLPRLAKLQRRMAGKKKFSSNWKKAKRRVTRLHSKIANIRKDFLHKSSNDISKNHAVVFVEDLQVKKMSASSKGRKAKPGKRVTQKSGLNRSILDASPFEWRRQLAYKTPWSGGLLVSVPPQNTSRKCPECQHTSAENRKTQAKFVCVECGFSAHADFVGAVNMKEAGLALLATFACSKGIVSGTHRSDSGAIVRLRAVGIPSVHGEEDVN
jgi:putative transposase